MTPGPLNITIRRGVAFIRTVTWRDAAGVPVDLTGYTAAELQISSDDPANPHLVLTHLNGLTLGGTAGTIGIRIPDENTATLPLGRWNWKLELTPPNGDDIRLLEGEARVAW